MKPVIWILEDNLNDRFVYEEIFGKKYKLEFFTTFESFLNFLIHTEQSCDLAIIDLQLPDGCFIEMIDLTPKMKFPFIVVSCRDDIETLHKCFEIGATDYIVKPLRKNELIVKIERIFGPSTLSPEQLRFNFSIDFIKNKLKASNALDVELTPTEIKIISYINDPKDSIDKNDLFYKIWDNVQVGKRTLDTHICNLRKKLKTIGLDIKSSKQGRLYLTKID